MGVGAGLVVDGEIYRGADYGAGEVGHWVMMPTGGALCSCGNRGCLETYISEAVLLEMAEKVHPELTTGRSEPLKVLFDAARDGHLGLIELLEDRAFYVGLALANVVNVLNPQLLMLGGWLHDAFDLIEPVVQRTLRKHAFGGIGRHVDVLPSSFGGYSGVTGAATLAFESFFFSRGMEGAAQMEPAQAPWVVAGRLPRA
jgi:glucokinase